MKLASFFVGAVFCENFSILKRVQLDSLCNDGSKLGVVIDKHEMSQSSNG